MSDRRRLTSTSANTYSTFRNRLDHSIQFVSLEERSVKEMLMGVFIRVCSFLIAGGMVALLVMFSYAYCQDTGDEIDMNPIPPWGENWCSVTIRNSSKRILQDLLVEKTRDVIYVQLSTDDATTESSNTYMYQPKKWIWAHGDAAILVWPTSYQLWSFGILDLHTERNLNIKLKLSPPGCKFEWGNQFTTIDIATGLLDFTKTLFEKQKKVKESKWCFMVKLRDPHKSALEKDFSFFVQDLGYKCCNYTRDSDGELQPYCSDEIIVERMWTNVPFIFAILTLMISPLFGVFVYQFLSFKSHVYWIHNKHKSHQEYASAEDEWVYTDYKSPISFFSFLQVPRVLKRNASKFLGGSKFVRRFYRHLLRAIFLAVFSLSVVLFSLVMYMADDNSYAMLKDEMDSDIPLGFLSLLFPSDNYDNFMTYIGGPTVFIGLYSGFAFLYVFFFGWCKPLDIYSDYTKGNFSLNLDLVETYGRIRCAVRDKHGLFETIHANYRAVFCLEFWCNLLKRLWCGDEAICLLGITNIQIILTIMIRIPVLVVSTVFSVLVHSIPIFFASILMLTEFLRRIRVHPQSFWCTWIFNVIQSVVLFLLHGWLIFSLTIIFFASAEFICLVFSFCVVSIILFPGAASGIFVFVLVAVYYIVSRIRSVARKYASLRDLTITVSQTLSDKCKGIEGRISKDLDKLTISGCEIRDFKHIVVVSVPEDETENQGSHNDRKLRKPNHCHLEQGLLKIIGEINTSRFVCISISGVLFNVERDHQMDGAKVHLEVKARDQELVLVQKQNTEDNPVVPEIDDSCYVTYRNSLPGIPWRLLDRVVEEYLPVSLERIKALLWTLMVIAVVAWLVLMIKRFDRWEDMSTIVNALMVVILVKMADITRMLSLDVSEAQRTEILKKQLRNTIQQYWMQAKHGKRENSS